MKVEPDVVVKATANAGGVRSVLRSSAHLYEQYMYVRSQLRNIRPTQYDITDLCNLNCKGCLYFAGQDREGISEVKDREAVEQFFAQEAARGVNYLQIAGAEPSLALSKVRIAAQQIPRGVIFTNGVKKIPADIPLRIHISIWEIPGQATEELRGADTLMRAVENYRDDQRAVFVFTINALNLANLQDAVRFAHEQGIKMTLSHFSPTIQDAAEQEALRLIPDDLARCERIVDQLMDQYPDTLIYSRAWNRWIHQPNPLYEINPANNHARDCGSVTTKHYRHYRVDLQETHNAKCCAPNLDCRTCRAYAQSLATILNRIDRFAGSEDDLSDWLEMAQYWCRIFL